jgi:hypothetical protein
MLYAIPHDQFHSQRRFRLHFVEFAKNYCYCVQMQDGTLQDHFCIEHYSNHSAVIIL